MRTLACFGLCSIVLWTAAARAEDKKPEGKFDPESIVGKWEIVSGVKNGTKADPKDLAKSTLEVTKDGMTLKGGDATFKFKYKLDTTATPVKIDLEMTESPFGAGMKAVGIVKSDKGEFTLAYDPMGEKRPEKFDGEKSFLFVMKKKADKKE